VSILGALKNGAGSQAFDAAPAAATGSAVAGSSADEKAVGVADDGSVYVGGIFLSSVDFDPGPGTATGRSA